MDLTWNLDNIYTSFESAEFQEDMKQLKKHIDTINKLIFNSWEHNKDSNTKIEEFLKITNEYKAVYSKVSTYAYLIMIADFQNSEAENYLDNIENKNTELAEVLVRFSRWFRDVKSLEGIIASSTYLLEHQFYLKELLITSNYFLSEKEEFLISKMKNTGSKAWEKFYRELLATSTKKITINGQIENLTLSELRNLMYDKERSLRKTAYLKEADLCKDLSQVCAKCINGISGEALTIYKVRGYESPLEKVLQNSRMDYKTLDVMMSAVKESLPIFHKYYLAKAKILGYNSKLPFYDIYAPIGDCNMKVTYEEAKNIITSCFNKFSNKLSAFSKKVFEERWIDAEPRKGKGNFGMSVDIFPIKESRIITNFNGNFNDVSILAHEIGHAYHSSNLYDQSLLNTEYSTPIAETASIFCETIVNNELMNKLPSNEALAILEKSISDTAYFIVDFYGRYLFENELFKRRESGALTIEELNQLMKKCMIHTYGDSIDAETFHPYMWMNKIGYFVPGNEYLNFPYSFGVLFSKGLYAYYLEKGQSFVEQYDKFLSETSRNNIVDVAKILEIDVQSFDFWRNSLKLIERDIEKLISIA